MECQQHDTTFVPFHSYNNTSITLNILVRIKWIKYIINTEMHFVGYLYTMNLISKCISWNKPTCMSILPTLMCLWCGFGYVDQNSGSIKRSR
jgi:hypothetical protein